MYFTYAEGGEQDPPQKEEHRPVPSEESGETGTPEEGGEWGTVGLNGKHKPSPPKHVKQNKATKNSGVVKAKTATSSGANLKKVASKISDKDIRKPKIDRSSQSKDSPPFK